MFDKILVAIDCSSANREVFHRALAVAKANQDETAASATSKTASPKRRTKLILLHILSEEELIEPTMSFAASGGDSLDFDPTVDWMDTEMYRRRWQDFEAEGINILRSLASEAIAAGVPTEFTQITGHPSSTICEFASSCRADVIVVGRRGYSGLKEIFLGSVSNYVVHNAPCSVLVVQTKDKSEAKASSLAWESQITPP